MTIKITANETGMPPGKLAEAEIHFTDGPLEGLKLIGFAIWERRTGGEIGTTGRRLNVTFPARTYSVNGERRSFALLRPISDTNAQDRIREAILEAYADFINPSDASTHDQYTGQPKQAQTTPDSPTRGSRF